MYNKEIQLNIHVYLLFQILFPYRLFKILNILSCAIKYCKTQNSGLCSKEEKPRDPINEPSRCNMQEGLLSVAQTGDSDLLGGRAHRTQIGQAFYRQKTILSAYYIRVTKWLVTCLQSNPIGTNFAGFCLNLKQFYWYKRCRLLFKLRHPLAFQLSRGLFTGCILIGWLHVTQWGQGIPPFHGNQYPSPGCLPAPAPAAPQYIYGGMILNKGLNKENLFNKWWNNWPSAILWFRRIISLVIQVIKIYFSYVFDLHSWFMVHSSPDL